uniref:Uncharacterized protein n=1 Tax=Arundo donax TaxID=35708 RepID=A0A0A9ARA0_ARUDO
MHSRYLILNGIKLLQSILTFGAHNYHGYLKAT